MLKPIYTITTIKKEQNTERTRCIGYFHSENTAIQAIKRNELDLQEHDYTYAVIERTLQGVYPYITKEIWFKWAKSKWTLCPNLNGLNLSAIGG
jgi:hypothetical protein